MHGRKSVENDFNSRYSALIIRIKKKISMKIKRKLKTQSVWFLCVYFECAFEWRKKTSNLFQSDLCVFKSSLNGRLRIDLINIVLCASLIFDQFFSKLKPNHGFNKKNEKLLNFHSRKRWILRDESETLN